MSKGESMSAERLVALADAYLLGELNAAQLAELERELKSSPVACNLFAVVTQQATMMHEVFATPHEPEAHGEDSETDDFLTILSALDAPPTKGVELVDLTDEVDRRERERKRSVRRHRGPGPAPAAGWSVPPYAVVLGVAAMFLLAFWLGGMMMGPSSPGGSTQSPEARVEREGRPRLLATHQAVWAGPSGEPRPWQDLRDMPLELKAGYAKIKMGNGASLLVEGPAQLRVTAAGRLQLMQGHVLASPPAGGDPLEIDAPGATLRNQNATFGVYVDSSAHTVAQVYEGELAVTPVVASGESASTISVDSSHAMHIDAVGQHHRAEPIAAGTFLDFETFDALQAPRGSVDYGRAVRRVWEHDPELLAAMSFPAGDLYEAYGIEGARVRRGMAEYAPASLEAQTDDERPLTGGRIVFDEALSTTVFLDLDLSPSSKAARSGLVRSDAQTLGRNGTRICLSWVMALDYDTPDNEQGWCGLSLFSGSDDVGPGEYLFMGRVAHKPFWGVEYRRSRSTQVPTTVEAFPFPEPGQTAFQQGQAVLWLMVIDFSAGADRVAIYQNPSAYELGQPVYVIDDVDFRIDRFRIEASDGTRRWSIDELRVGTTVRSVLRN